MIPDETGRYCNSCQKSVIDFTAKTDEEIQQFFINNFSQPVCARFKNTQIHRIVIDLPQNIFSTKMPMWMRFLVACLIIFGISIFPFQTTVAGKLPAEISFFQDEPVAVKAKKKVRLLKKKKGRRARRLETIEVPMMVLGYIAISDNPFPLNIERLTCPDDSNQIPTLEIYPKEITIPAEPLPKKEHPVPTPFMPDKFILPSVLMFRRKNNNNPMD